MGFYRIADRVFEINARFEYFDRVCRDYVCDAQPADLKISVSDEELELQRELARKLEQPDNNDGYLEFLAVYKLITEYLYQEDCFLFHAAVISFDSKAYAFTAKSGTGKTTHIRLWKKNFGDRVAIVNGDKPLIRRVKEDGREKFIAYGTPWCGKEGYQDNVGVELAGICVLRRGEENEIHRITSDEAVPELYTQMMLFSDAKYMSSLLDMLDGMVSNIPIYALSCNMEDEAAKVSCRAMTGANV